MKSPLLRRSNLEVDQFANFAGLNSVFLIKLDATIRLSRIILFHVRVLVLYIFFFTSPRARTFRRTVDETR